MVRKQSKHIIASGRPHLSEGIDDRHLGEIFGFEFDSLKLTVEQSYYIRNGVLIYR
jgi:hypothetical protein